MPRARGLDHLVGELATACVIQIGAAAMPPIALLAAVHGIALAVRAGASGWVYSWAVCATAVIDVGAFAVSFLALRDLMRAIGYSSTTAWMFPAIIDTAVAVSTLMLVAAWINYPDGAADRKGCRRASAAAVRGGRLTLGLRPFFTLGAVSRRHYDIRTPAVAIWRAIRMDKKALGG